jgi:hypothetical protein
MSLSSDEIIKRQIVDTVKSKNPKINIRIFTQSSRDDQKYFSKGGLTFGFKGVLYGSCDACWYVNEQWIDGFDGKKINEKPIIALEGTDALNRKSSGNAQYQRFHHALGAVKNGVVGIYFLKKGVDKIQADLFGMAYYSSLVEKGKYLIIDDLAVVSDLLNLYGTKLFDQYIANYQKKMLKIFTNKFNKLYNGDWQKFAENRSTIIKDTYVIKYAGRMRRNFLEGSQRAGHIAVGEMFLTKYYFYDKKFYYLFPKMSNEDLKILDASKRTDKEWFLLRNEHNVEIKTLDDIKGLDTNVRKVLLKIKDKPIKGPVFGIYIKCIKNIEAGLKSGKLTIL